MKKNEERTSLRTPHNPNKYLYNDGAKIGIYFGTTFFLGLIFVSSMKICYLCQQKTKNYACR